MNSIDYTKNVALYLGVSISWLKAARVRGDGPPFIKMGHSVRYRKEDIDRWMLQNQRTNTLKFEGGK